MPKLINNWDDLGKQKSKDGKYKIQIEESGYCGWIVPVEETEETKKDYFKHHQYLSTHTFYGSTYKESTKKLQDYGFDVEIETWDKEKN